MDINGTNTKVCYKLLSFWVNIATIIACLVAFLSLIFYSSIFFFDHCYTQEQKMSSYFGALEAIKKELTANHNVISREFLEKKDEYLTGAIGSYSRYYTNALNKAVMEGTVKDDDIAVNFFNIVQREDMINRILDYASLLTHSSTLESNEKIQEKALARFKEDNANIFKQIDQLEILIPETIHLIDIHINTTSSNPAYFLHTICFHANNLRKKIDI